MATRLSNASVRGTSAITPKSRRSSAGDLDSNQIPTQDDTNVSCGGARSWLRSGDRTFLFQGTEHFCSVPTRAPTRRDRVKTALFRRRVTVTLIPSVVDGQSTRLSASHQGVEVMSRRGLIRALASVGFDTAVEDAVQANRATAHDAPEPAHG
jgi:hypothetical protein